MGFSGTLLGALSFFAGLTPARCPTPLLPLPFESPCPSLQDEVDRVRALKAQKDGAEEQAEDCPFES